MPKITLDWNTLYNFVTDAFVAVGVPRNDAVICTDVLLESDKRGIESHGVNRFKPIYIDRILDKIQKPVTEFEILRETPTTAVVDGHDGMGQVVGYKAMSMAIEKAKKYGMGMVAARNSCHYGIAGYYATMATKANMIGITGTNARPSIAPTFGVENMLGTNPLTIGLAFLPAIVLGSILYQSWSLAFVYGGDAFEAFFLTKLASRSVQFGVTFVLDVLIVWLLYKAKVFSSAKLWPPVSGAQKPTRED